MHSSPTWRGPLALALAAALVPPAAALTTAAATAAGPSTELLSVSSTGTKGDSDSQQPVITPDGRWAAFWGHARNLVAPASNGAGNVFLRDRLRGETRQVSLGPGGVQPNGESSQPSISDDGRFVAFYSTATNLADSPGGFQGYLYDRDQGSIRRISTNVAPTSFYTLVNTIRVSGDGRRVVYTANTADASRSDVFVAEVAGGAPRRLAEPAPGVQANASVSNGSLSGDARFAAYATAANNLVPSDANGYSDVFVENLETGAKERVSLTSTDGEADASSALPSLDRDGCTVVFASSATNLVAGATSRDSKAFVRDRCTGDTEAASVSNLGVVGANSGRPSISGDGCVVAFVTRDALLPAPVTRGVAVRDRCAGLTSRVDLSTAGEPSNGAATPGVELGGLHGRYIAFGSSGTNLSGADGDALLDAFVRDRANNIAPATVLVVSQQGARVTVDVSGSRDPDGYQLSGSTSFGDGSADAGGLVVSHDYARSGTYTVAVTVTDADGATARAFQAVTVPDPPAGGGPAGPGPGADPGSVPGPGAGGGGGGGGTTRPAALRLSGARLSRSRFAVAPARGRAGGNAGATLTATLSEAATLTLSFERQLAGHRVRGRCVAGAPAGGRRRGRCALYRKAGTQSRAASAGRVSMPLSGRTSGGALQLGAHRLTVVARTADGRRAQAVLTFTVVARSAR